MNALDLIRRIMPRGVLVAAVIAMALPAAVEAQVVRDPGVHIQRGRTTPVRLSGPRVGVTWFQGKAADSLEAELGIGPVITQFGWQFEHRLFSIEGGASGVSEYVILLGGLDQSEVIPSLSWIMGVRTFTGFEVGAGPNVSPAGVSLVGAVGLNFQNGGINYPVNFALASAKSGVRATVLIGFNTKNEGI